jgi:phage replication-related protein YjqB (UPF0714/DUF867 family)
MPDKYSSFAELARNEVEGIDFAIEILSENRDPSIAVIAPHGGGIEPHTCLLAKAVAGNDLTFYAFKGIKSDNNKDLHITSHRFDEPRAQEVVSRANRVLAFHGKSDSGDFVMVGGLDETLGLRLRDCLTSLHVEVRQPSSNAAGKHPANICNSGASRVGVQLELSMSFRKLLAADDVRRSEFARKVRQVLREDPRAAG